MKKYIILIPFLLSYNLFAAEAAPDTITETEAEIETKPKAKAKIRECAICTDNITEQPLFDINNPGTRNAYLICPEQATKADENHSNQCCESCLTVHLLRDPKKACPTCRTPGKIKIQKLKKIASNPSVKKIEADYLNNKGKGAVYQCTDFSSFSIIWNPLNEKFLFHNEPFSIFIKAGTFKEDAESDQHEEKFSSLPIILFTRWIHVAQSDPQLITQLKESYPDDEDNLNIKNFLTLLETGNFPFSQLNTQITKIKEEADIIKQQGTLFRGFLTIKNEILEKEYEKVHTKIQSNIITFRDELKIKIHNELSKKSKEWNERIKEKLKEEQERLQDAPNKEELLQNRATQLTKEANTYLKIEERESLQKNQRVLNDFVEKCEKEQLARQERIITETKFAIKAIVPEEYLQEHDKLLKMQNILINYKANIYATLFVKKVDNVYIPENCFPTKKPSPLNALANERGLKILLTPMTDQNDITTRFMQPEKTANLF